MLSTLITIWIKISIAYNHTNILTFLQHHQVQSRLLMCIPLHPISMEVRHPPPILCCILNTIHLLHICYPILSHGHLVQYVIQYSWKISLKKTYAFFVPVLMGNFFVPMLMITSSRWHTLLHGWKLAFCNARVARLDEILSSEIFGYTVCTGITIWRGS